MSSPLEDLTSGFSLERDGLIYYVYVRTFVYHSYVCLHVLYVYVYVGRVPTISTPSHDDKLQAHFA